MKKLLLLFCLAVISTNVMSQDTLLYENFDMDPTANWVPFPSGNDMTWVNYDEDGIPDGNARPQEWYWSDGGGFATVDTADDCMFSSSWLQGFAPGNRNWMMTPPIDIVDASAMLSWSSAPRQTPLYLDGYLVLISTTDNVETSFTDTLFEAAQFLAGTGNDFSAYTFSSGFVHGMDGTYIEFDPTADSSRFVGEQRPFSESLAAYSGETIYIAFLHNSDDDNLISIDDVMVTGTMSTGITDVNVDIGLNVYPNPAEDLLEISYRLPSTSPVKYSIYDISGKLVDENVRGIQIAGMQKLSIDVSSLAAGQYSVAIEHSSGRSTTKFIKQ